MLHRMPHPCVPMLLILGLFQLAAAFATFVPSLVHDRVAKQFTPVWAWVTAPLVGDNPDVVHGLAVGSQIVIGTTEAIIAVQLFVALVSPAKRLVYAQAGLGLAVLLFGAFLLTMFLMHDKSLPAWNQYPAILGWYGVTWLLVAHEHHVRQQYQAASTP